MRKARISMELRLVLSIKRAGKAWMKTLADQAQGEVRYL
jgi:hypothetical protein